MHMSDCIEWTGATTKGGYGVVRVGATSTTAHRAAWIAVHGPVPAGLEIDHLCRNTRCVNVDHLEAVTPSENVRRSPRAQVTHCPAGHPLSGDNLYLQTRTRNGRPWRLCVTCREARRA